MRFGKFLVVTVNISQSKLLYSICDVDGGSIYFDFIIKYFLGFRIEMMTMDFIIVIELRIDRSKSNQPPQDGHVPSIVVENPSFSVINKALNKAKFKKTVIRNF